MTDGHRGSRRAEVVKCAIAGLVVTGAALAGAAPSAADPAPPGPLPIPGDPVAAPADQPIEPPPAAPAGPPSVPEIANPVYGSGQSGSGPIGTLRDLWHQARDPYGVYDPARVPGGGAPPPGAGEPPPLPPGYVSLNAPGSETPSASTDSEGRSYSGGPALPPGYYPLDGPPPPDYEYLPPTAPGRAAPVIPPA